MALERERALLSVLSESERDTLIRLLKRLHENLPTVETAMAHYIRKHHPHAARRHYASPTTTASDAERGMRRASAAGHGW